MCRDGSWNEVRHRNQKDKGAIRTATDKEEAKPSPQLAKIYSLSGILEEASMWNAIPLTIWARAEISHKAIMIDQRSKPAQVCDEANDEAWIAQPLLVLEMLAVLTKPSCIEVPMSNSNHPAPNRWKQGEVAPCTRMSPNEIRVDPATIRIVHTHQCCADPRHKLLALRATSDKEKIQESDCHW